MTPAVGKPVWRADGHPEVCCPGAGSVLWLVQGGQRSAKMTTRSALRAPRGLGGRHVFLIEPQWSEESLILISGDRNPIFRGDS